MADVDVKDMGFIAPAPLRPEVSAADDVFAQLLAGADDDDRAVEPTDDDLGTLEYEWDKLERLGQACDAVEARLEVLNKDYNAQKERMLLAMKREGTRQFKGASGGACVVATQYTTSVEDEARFMDWVKETHPELLTVHSQSRTSFIRKNYRDRGIPTDDPAFPPGLKAGERESLQVRGIKPPAVQGD